LKNIIEKYQEFERIQNIIKDSLKDISVDEQSKKTLTEIYQTEFQRAVDQTLMTNLDSLNAETLKDNIEEALNN
jgi:RecJ-like exonuclease